MKSGLKKKNSRFLLELFVSGLVVLAAALLSYISGFDSYYFIPFLLAPAFFIRKSIDAFMLILFTALLAVFMHEIPYFTPFIFSLIIFVFPLYIVLRRTGTLSKALYELGFSGRPVRAFFIALLSLIPTAVILFLLSYSAAQFNVDDSSFVNEKLAALPLYVLVYAATIGPLAEEVFFRSFLVRYMHPIFANLLFALAHFSYGSYIEIIGAFVMGMLLYYFYSRSNDIKVAIFLHIMINVGSIIAMVGS